MFSLGIFMPLAFSIAWIREGLDLGSVPFLAAKVIKRESLENICPLFLSVRAFLCFIVLHLECPDIGCIIYNRVSLVGKLRCFNPPVVITRPFGVRDRKPICIRYGS